MKINHILLTISCLIIINLDFVFSQIHSDIPKREKHKIEQRFKESSTSSQLQNNALDMDFADSLFIYIPEVDKIQPEPEQLGYFGYDFFTNSLDRAIWDNQPPQREYILGSGDELIIEVWGDTQLRSTHIIDQYGRIYVDKIGQIHATGTTLQNIEAKLLKKFQNVYSSLKGDQPTAILDVSIGKLKSINVTLIGETGRPGIHAIHPFSTIITGLLQTGGILETGSLRNIQLIRNGGTSGALDFYQYLLNGNTKKDLRLLDGDIIFIPFRKSSVSIEGEIVKKAIYELTAGETLEQLIQYSGGFTAKAQKNIRIHRIYSMQMQAQLTSFNETLFIDYLSNNNFVLEDADEVLVYKIASNLNEISVYGQVKNPGQYSFNTAQDMNLLDVLTLAGGINDRTFIKTIYQKHGEIIRNHPETDYPEIISFDIEKLLAGDPEENKLLQNWDIVLIRQNPNYISPKKVTLTGEVQVPGIYTLQKKWETLDDILKRAGGFTKKAYQDGIRMYRGNEQIALKNFAIVLSDGDSLMVPEHPGVVQVLGAVNRPGLIQYDKKKTLRDYLENAGGFSIDADYNNITIIYANGDVRIKKRFRNPNIYEGATIIVQIKDLKEPFNITEYASNMASIITSFATLYFLITTK